jgi:hypothetical protein
MGALYPLVRCQRPRSRRSAYSKAIFGNELLRLATVVRAKGGSHADSGRSAALTGWTGTFITDDGPVSSRHFGRGDVPGVERRFAPY